MVIGRKDDSLEPFKRDKLFARLYKSCGHRQKPVEDATALTATTIARIIQKHGQDGAIPSSAITEEALAVLRNFDKAAATYYKAYFAAKQGTN